MATHLDIPRRMEEDHNAGNITCAGVKCKTSNFRWFDEKVSPPETSPVRVVEMHNEEIYESGEGEVGVLKRSKPVCTLTLERGLVKGLAYRPQFQLSNGVKFPARIDQPTSEFRDPSTLQLKTLIPVEAQRSVVTELTSKTSRYSGRFQCDAILTGSVGILGGKLLGAIPIEDLGNTSFVIRGRLTVDFQNEHILDVK